MSGTAEFVCSELDSVLYALPCLEVEGDGDADELALACAMMAREAVRVLDTPLVRHLGRVSQDAEQCRHRDERRHEREHHHDGEQVSSGALGEACADGAPDVVGRVGGNEPRDTRDDGRLPDHHKCIATRLRVAPADDEVPFTVALPLVDQHEPESSRAGH